MNDTTNTEPQPPKPGRSIFPPLNRPLTDLETQRLAAVFDLLWTWKQAGLKKQTDALITPEAAPAPALAKPPRKTRRKLA